MLLTFYLVFATFFLWETVRFALAEFTPGIYSTTSVLHPVVVAVLPVVYLWPDWIRGLAVAGLVGLIHALVSRFVPEPVQTYNPPRRESRRPGLTPLP